MENSPPAKGADGLARRQRNRGGSVLREPRGRMDAAAGEDAENRCTHCDGDESLSDEVVVES